MRYLHNVVPHSVVSHCAHPTVPIDIWARCNSVSWDNSTLGLVVWIGIDGWLLWINLQVNSQATKLSYFCVETYKLSVRGQNKQLRHSTHIFYESINAEQSDAYLRRVQVTQLAIYSSISSFAPVLYTPTVYVDPRYSGYFLNKP